MKPPALALAALAPAIVGGGVALGIEPPSVAGLVTVESEGLLEFRIVAAPA